MNESDETMAKIVLWSKELQRLVVVQRVNNIAVFACGALFNVLALYMIIFKSTKSMEQYKKIMLVSASVDVWLLSMAAITQCFSQTIENHHFVFTFNGPAAYFGPHVQFICIGLLLSGLISQSTIVCLEFYFRYYLTKNRAPPSSSLLISLVIVAIAVGLVEGVFIILDGFVLNSISTTTIDVRNQTSNFNYILISNATNSRIALISAIYRVVSSMLGFFVTLFIAFATLYIMRKQMVILSRNTKTRAEELIEQYARMCYAKLMIPCFAIVIPIFLKAVLSQFKIDNAILSELTTLAFLWLPVVNAIATLIFIKTYRQTLLRTVSRFFGHKTIDVASTVFEPSQRTINMPRRSILQTLS